MLKTCTVCGKEKDETDFAWKSILRGKRSSECKMCHSIYRDNHYRLHQKEHYASVIQRRRELQDKVVVYKAERGCSRCPEHHPAALDFHHIDASGKISTIARITRLGWSWERILTEIIKCEILCANCHRKEHWNKAEVSQWQSVGLPNQRRRFDSGLPLQISIPG